MFGNYLNWFWKIIRRENKMKYAVMVLCKTSNGTLYWSISGICVTKQDAEFYYFLTMRDKIKGIIIPENEIDEFLKLRNK